MLISSCPWCVQIVTEVISNVRTVASLTKENYFLEQYRIQINKPFKCAHTCPFIACSSTVQKFNQQKIQQE